MSAATLLAADTVADYLGSRGLVDGRTVRVGELAGGVSCVVLEVTDGDRAWVVKQALPRLRVAEEWYADPARTLTEAKALRLVGGWTPEHVPAVIDVDPERFVLVIERAPSAMTAWKSQLLAGRCDAGVGQTLGTVLGRWHRYSHDDPVVQAELDARESFEELRVAPYLRATAASRPWTAEPIAELIDHMARRRRCLVHGDFSPKNILVGAGRVWVLDFEVAHRGDPDFDVAFLLSHLLAKAIQHPEHGAGLRRCASAFVAAYEGEIAGSELAAVPTLVPGHLGALLLARVHGKSPLEYLDARGRQQVATAGRSLLEGPWDLGRDVWTNAMSAVEGAA